MVRGLEHFSRRKAESVGVVQPGEEKALGRPYCSLSVPEIGLCIRVCCDKTRGNDFKLKED